MITYDYDPEWAVTLFPYDHDCNPAQIMHAIQRGEELTYTYIQIGMREEITLKAASGEIFTPPHNRGSIYIPLYHAIWNAMRERGYCYLKYDKSGWIIGIPKNDLPYRRIEKINIEIEYV
jgi:hypothetical protein